MQGSNNVTEELDFGIHDLFGSCILDLGSFPDTQFTQ